MKKLILFALILSAGSLKAQDRFTKVSEVVDVEKVLSDTLYSANVYVTFKDVKNLVPNFVKDTNVVSTNFMTGFQVDAQRANAVNELVGRVND